MNEKNSPLPNRQRANKPIGGNIMQGIIVDIARVLEQVEKEKNYYSFKSGC